MKHLKTGYLLGFLLFAFAMPSHAQCEQENTAFKSGEFMSYNLYYNWKFIWVKAGTASMSTVETRYKGRPAYRASLITRGNRKADDLFVLRDTLLCYCSTGLAPLYFRKGAREGNRYTVDEVFYDYKGGSTNVRLHRQKNDGSHINSTHKMNKCVYDMLNIFLKARSFDPKNWKKGHTIVFDMADGRKVEKAQIQFNGKTVVKADNGKKYNCLQLSYMENEDGKCKEIVRFYVTDDANHMPVRLDLFLRFGTAKAFLTDMRGLRNPCTAEKN